jgi:hypothetical protein
MPNCGEAYKLLDDAWAKQWEKVDGSEDYKARNGNYSLADRPKSHPSYC